MAKFFPLNKTKTVTKIVEVPVGDGSAVNNEQLRYDNRNQAKKAAETAVAAAVAQEFGKKSLETVTAAFAAEVREVNQKSAEFISVQSNIQEFADKAIETVSVVGQVREFGNKDQPDTIDSEFSVSEIAKRTQEDINNEVTAIARDIAKRATDTTSAVASVFEAQKKATDTISADFSIAETAKKTVEDVSNTVTARAAEIAKRAIETIQAAIVARTDLNKKSVVTEVVEITLNGYANQNVSNTGWTNQANILGNTTNTSASLTATSSGLLGTTNNTTTGTTVLGFRDVNLGDLTITSVILSVENSGATAGVALVQPVPNIQYQYSLNNGGTWTTFYTHTTPALTKGIRTVDITAIVGQNQTLLSALQIRATGQTTSGTGIGAGYTASFFRAWMTVLANRTYT